MARSDDLAQVLGGGPLVDPRGAAQPMSYRQGKVLAWNAATLENTIDVGGATLTNVPVLGVAEADSITAGSVVGIMVVGSTWAIIGRLVVPGTTQATDAITRVSQRIYTATVDDFDTLNSGIGADFADLSPAGPSVSVTIGAAGRALVFLTARVVADTASSITGNMSFAVSGASTVAASNDRQLQIAGAIGRFSGLVEVSGLTAGTNVFTAKYQTVGGEIGFSDRNITVYAL